MALRGARAASRDARALPLRVVAPVGVVGVVGVVGIIDVFARRVHADTPALEDHGTAR
jgi:hypothetical protein